MFNATLIVKEPENEAWIGKGRKSFKVFPHIGELIELDINQLGYMYKVVAIAHPGDRSEDSADIYAVQLGQTLQVLKELFQNS